MPEQSSIEDPSSCYPFTYLLFSLGSGPYSLFLYCTDTPGEPLAIVFFSLFFIAWPIYFEYNDHDYLSYLMTFINTCFTTPPDADNIDDAFLMTTYDLQREQ